MARLTRARSGRADSGATTSEYALVLAGVAGATLLAFALLVPAVGDLFDRAICALGVGCGPRSSVGASVDPWDHPDPVVRATWGKVVVLGDSYSSGEAAEDYGVAGSTESCHASANAYGPRLARRLDVSDRLTVRACTGARIDHLAGRYADHHQPAQLDALDEDTSLVTLTIGGNDLDWAEIIQICVLDRTDRCRAGTDVGNAVDRRIENIGPRLEQTYEAIHRRAPNARIVTIGYPRFFPSPPTHGLRYSGLPLLDITEQAWMNDRFDAFNEVIARSAEAAGVEYVDVGAALRGHELTSDRPWMRGPTLGLPISAASFHPTADGQKALADVVERQIRFPATPARS